MKSKRILSMLLAVLMTISVAFVSVASTSAAESSVASVGYTGSGTEADPYIANSSADLYGFIHSDKHMFIKLGQDITITSTIYVESNITIDMNGKTLTMNASDYGFNIKSGCSLKIKGSGKIVQKGTKLWAIFFVEGTLETSGSVTYECPKESGNPICMSRYGVARIYGGNFVGDQISINGGAKVYVYGGTISTNVLITEATQLYVYDGTFEKRVYNNGYFVSFGGEFLEDVSSITKTGEAILYGGHFVKGVGRYSPLETGGSHSLGSNALCYCKKLNTVADNGVYLSNEITVFSPDFAEQTPEIKLGQTELDLGAINSLEDYYVSFKAKDVPAGFVELGYTIEEKLIVKDSDGFVETYDIKSGTKGQGVKLNLGNLTGGDYTVERTINLYNGPSLVKTNKSTIKVKVNPIDDSAFGFATLNPAVSAEDMEDNYTDLPATDIGTQTLNFGFTPFISTALSDKGFSVKSKVYINYNNQGTIKTLNSGKTFNLMDYVDKTGDYQVWFTVSLYNGDEYVTSKSHIYNIPIVDNNAPDYLTVIFTAESNAQAGGFLQVDVEKMAEKSDEFLEALINGEVYGQWYVNGSKIDGATASRFDIPSDYAGKSIYVEVFYGDNSIESDNLLISEGNPLYYKNPDWGKTEEDIIKAVEYTLNSDGTYSADVIVDVDCFDGQVYYYDVEGLGYYYYDHNNKFHGGSIGGAITKPARDEIRFQIASDLQPGTQWRAKVYLAHDVYADYEIQGYSFSWVNLTVPELPESTVTGLLGDADLNGTVNVKDATAIQKHLADIQKLSETGVVLADVDGNNNVNIKDATAIQKYVAGMNTGFDIGKEI